ncbi:hypothetical protein I6N95_14135 [Vagococcus sp. BWB3-3]|uniref:Uncharacterized protein n=1 Tax=Vagococcus allomyrinae TaxID=2794353 RepID=A0A940P6V2_9ENTE|nr:hypothetical protein [Vagococcus allomyrinae]MBP1042155.1 hypothetical protein [Vagococcus allomyrinae]
MGTYSQRELNEAKKAIDSLVSKSQKAKESLASKDLQRYKGQLTLLTNRIKALEIASELITNELD